MNADEKNDQNVIEAAGGLLWRNTADGEEIALIHRCRYDDWTLPKGKREPGESWIETARREVLEETGCLVKVGQFAGGQVYTVNGLPKVVLYWHMRLHQNLGFHPNREVDQLVWLPVDDAIMMLSYAAEKSLLKTNPSP
jgi:8-oxo-dGTP diphosphatase